MRKKKKYKISGMSCAACAKRVESAVSAVPGVESCEVNLLLGTMSVLSRADEEKINFAVKEAGYGISNYDDADTDIDIEAAEIKSTTSRLWKSIILLLLLIYISMGHVMWGWPLPYLSDSPIALGAIQLVLSLSVMIINRKFFIGGARAVIHRSPNMDTLVALGSSTSFIYSLVLFIMMIVSGASSDMEAVHTYLHGLYFESAAMIPALITLGKMLEARAKGKTTSAIRELLALSPKNVNVLRGEGEVSIPIDELSVGDIFVVRRGEAVAADGVIVMGEGSFDEAALTGESLPADKGVGDRVFCATHLKLGFIHVKATSVREDTVISEIVRMVKEASGSAAPVAKIADRVAGIFVPFVIGVSLVSLAIWLIIRGNIGFALARAVSVLVISCPCALGLATPVAIMVGSGVGAKNKILFKNATALEAAGGVKIVCLDKTGTITEGRPHVADVIPVSIDREELLLLAASLEHSSEHPLGRAICEAYCGELLQCTSFVAGLGGVSGEISGKRYFGGNIDFIARNTSAKIAPDVKQTVDMLSADGKTSLVFLENDKIIGIIALADKIKDDSPEAIARLRAMGTRVVMLTGDNAEVAARVAEDVGIDEVFSGIFPAEKRTKIESLRAEGSVAMVGDGVNDAPALASADVGIAIGAGANVAIDSADIVLSRGGISDVVNTLLLSKNTLRNIYENLFFAFVYNIIAIPLAAGAFIPLGLTLEPMFGALAMSISSFLVVINSLRLNMFKPIKPKNNLQTERKATDNRSREEIKINKETEDIKMEKLTLKIKGMMCPHCEARVRNAILALEGVGSADVSHERATAEVEYKAPANAALISEAVVKCGYEVTM